MIGWRDHSFLWCSMTAETNVYPIGKLVSGGIYNCNTRNVEWQMSSQVRTEKWWLLEGATWISAADVQAQGRNCLRHLWTLNWHVKSKLIPNALSERATPQAMATNWYWWRSPSVCDHELNGALWLFVTGCNAHMELPEFHRSKTKKDTFPSKSKTPPHTDSWFERVHFIRCYLSCPFIHQ